MQTEVIVRINFSGKKFRDGEFCTNPNLPTWEEVSTEIVALVDTKTHKVISHEPKDIVLSKVDKRYIMLKSKQNGR